MVPPGWTRKDSLLLGLQLGCVVIGAFSAAIGLGALAAFFQGPHHVRLPPSLVWVPLAWVPAAIAFAWWHQIRTTSRRANALIAVAAVLTGLIALASSVPARMVRLAASLECEQNDASACLALADMLWAGRGGANDAQRAARTAERACYDLTDPKGCAWLVERALGKPAACTQLRANCGGRASLACNHVETTCAGVEVPVERLTIQVVGEESASGTSSTTPEAAVGAPVPAFERHAGGAEAPPRSALSGVVQLALGAMHSCARTVDGAVYCWGGNKVGQLGDGTMTSSKVAQRVPGVTDVVHLSAGLAHTCAVRRSGSVVCWGANADAQLGDGTNLERRRPVVVLDIDDAVEVAAGMSSACVRHRDGAVSCWGRRADLSPASVGPNHQHLPTLVPQLDDASMLAAGSLHTCTLRGYGRVGCWGSNLFGVFGNGTREASGVPATALLDGAAQSVVCGDNHTCALLQGGHVACWGLDDRGQLGFRDEAIDHEPTPRLVPALTGVVELSAGGNLTCGRQGDGRTLCWGTLGDDVEEPAPVEVAGLGDVHGVAIAMGGRGHACGIRADATVSCWGANEAGQLGNGTQEPQRVPGQVLAASTPLAEAPPAPAPPTGPHLSNIAEVRAGRDATCVRTVADQALCWGRRHARPATDPEPSSTTPLPVPGLPAVAALGLGFSASCAVDRMGAVWCWGAGDAGQLGHEDAVQDAPTRVDGTTGAVGVVVAYERACAHRHDGTLLCWGRENPSPETLAALGAVEAYDVGAGHMCVVQRGKVLCQGQNDDGELGDGQGGCAPDPSASCPPGRRCRAAEVCARSEQFVAVVGVDDAVSVAVGDDFSCALLRDGGVRCWGSNFRGQLGEGTGEGHASAVAVVDVRDGVEISGAARTVCVRHVDGRVSCWGDNTYGQRGDRTNLYSLRPEPVYQLDDAVQISVARSHACALRADASVVCWGDNRDGQLGDGTQERRHAPVPVRAP